MGDLHRLTVSSLSLVVVLGWFTLPPPPPSVRSPLPDGGRDLVARQACSDTIPSWLRSVMVDLTTGAGRWIASNAAYRSESEPNDEYGLEWGWGLGRQTVRGRLFGIRAEREVGDFWEFRLAWHPGECQAILYQFGVDGTMGVGPMTSDGQGGTVIDQVFHHPGGTSERVKHESIVRGNEEHGVSFQWVNGTWQKRRTYIWRRVS